MKNPYQLLRDELDYRLHSAELDGLPADKAMADLIGLALTLAVAIDGPVKTEARIKAHLDHMRRSFQSVYGRRDFPPTEGNA